MDPNPPFKNKFPPLITASKPRNTNSIVVPENFNHSINHPNLGAYGVITAILLDPFSQLVGHLTNNDQISAIGFYYVHNHQKIITLLYNHDGSPVPWINSETTIESLLQSAHVHKIRCYPLISNYDRLKTLILNMNPVQPNYHKLWSNISSDINQEGSFQMGTHIICKILKELDPDSKGLSSSLLRKHISMKSSRKTKSIFILETSRKSLESLCMTFVDLFMNKNGFRTTILNSHKTRLTREHKLIANIVCGLEHGILSTATLNDLITNLDPSFPKIHHPKSTVEITDDALMCTFTDLHGDLSKLTKLGSYIASLPYDASLINLYNDLIKDTPLDPISIPSPSITVKTGKNTIVLSINHPDLTGLSESELKDVLVYIDSLRSSNGVTDTRFVPLQNAILQTLAKK
jgi:hypothetical protein